MLDVTVDAVYVLKYEACGCFIGDNVLQFAVSLLFELKFLCLAVVEEGKTKQVFCVSYVFGWLVFICP